MRLNRVKYFFIVMAYAILSFNGLGANSIKTEHATWHMTVKQDTVQETPYIQLNIEMEEGWYTYWKDPGDTGYPLSINWHIPDTIQLGDMRWPKPTVLNYDGLKSHIIKENGTWAIPLYKRANLTVTDLSISAELEYLICKDICIPEQVTLNDTIKDPLIAAITPYRVRGHTEKAAAHNGLMSKGTLVALLFAFLGGIILNAMPCVFPIFSLKVLAIVKKSQHDNAAVRLQGVGYAAGVTVSFLALGGVLVFLQKTGELLGWGFHLQSPLFIGALIYVLFLVGLNLSGFYELSPHLFQIPSWIASHFTRQKSNESVVTSFFMGVLATIVATPCTAPLMAPAIGYGLAKDTVTALLVFFFLGVGMSVPYLCISFFPLLRKWLPAPGKWMQTFKECLAFPMYAAVIWLIWVLIQQTNSYIVVSVSGGLLALTFLLWIWSKIQNWGYWKVVVVVLLFGFIGSPFGTLLLGKNGAMKVIFQDEKAFSYQRLNTLISEQKPVFVDATAAWCISCKINEKLVLNSEDIKHLFKERQITVLIADWTNYDDEITQYLKEFGRSGVPLYVYYPPNKEPVVLPQILRKSVIIDAIKKE